MSILTFSACSDFLDTLPDNRVELNNADLIKPLLVSAYPNSSPALMGEMSSDNVMDNGGQFVYGVAQQQIYLWEDVTENDVDAPYGLWESCYKAIASANQALEAIRDLGMPASLDALRGEAYMCRAYAHFLLANIFCMPYNPSTAEQNLGIPYVTEPEKEVVVQYERGTLAKTYENIASDIETGLPLIDDASYSVPKYHFNRKAAHAFAARFYLFYQKWDKVIAHADVAIGSNPANSLRHWEDDFGSISLVSDAANAYISEKKVANLLILPALSSAGYIMGPYPDIGDRYGQGRVIANAETVFNGTGIWTKRGGLTMSNFVISVQQKNPFPKQITYFEYTDKTAGIGYRHIVSVPFTTDETILCRAEAYVLGSQHDYAKALSDINNWILYHSVGGGQDLTIDDVNAYYNALPYAPVVLNSDSERSVKKTLNPEGFTVAPGTEENLIQLILQLRRLEKLQEGDRWYDLKRYGIEFSHNCAGNVPEVLLKGDLRRAIQLPQDVINAGMQPNPRSN
jgi:hypothetical protein